MSSEARTPGERRWAFLAHASIFASLSIFTLVLDTTTFVSFMFLGPFVAYLIYFLNRRSRDWVAMHGLQSTFFQLLVITLVLLTGLVYLTVLGFMYALYGAVMCLMGRNFRYLLVGPLAQSIVSRVNR